MKAIIAMAAAAFALLSAPAKAVDEEEIRVVYEDLISIGMISRFEYKPDEIDTIINKYLGREEDQGQVFEWCFYRTSEDDELRQGVAFARQTSFSVLFYWYVEQIRRELPTAHQIARVRHENAKIIGQMRVNGTYIDFGDDDMCVDIVASSVGRGG